MFSIITTEPSTTMPKSSAPSESRLAGMWIRSRQMAANSSAKGMVSATMMAPRTLPRNRNRMMETRIMPAVRLSLHRVDGELDQIRAVEEGNDLHALGQDAVVQLVDFVVNALQDRIGVVALLQQHDAFDGVGVVDDGSVRAMGGAADLPEADLWSLRNSGDVLDSDWLRRSVVLTTVFSMSCTLE